ncbi:MAG: helix-turn-helix domain-containing protein [Nanoarchaeota archaeon]|nr:helix-turn-helix domain-containing protein [Nanoarchaeota archaeon]
MDESCTIYKTADFIGKRWTLIILLELSKGSGTKRYNELKKAIPGITPKILSERLKELEHEGMIKKRIDSSKFPIKCEYTLTKSGKEFFKIIQDMKKWSLKWKFNNKLCANSSCENCKL